MPTGSVELLAPAPNADAGIAAIDHGADAVYIGGMRFGARKAAGNSLDDIARLCEYAHRYWARVYVTVNTLLHDDELADAVALIRACHERGADAAIIQDVGLLECDLPPIPLIASTQMHNDTPDKVAFLERVGFSRVILARELSLDEIRAIRTKTPIELEAFVHGALCVCYSGQCYLSHAWGGRSGNRGECAQPCRKAYSLLDTDGNVLARNRHLLSLKDLNLSDHLGRMIDAGITSFKIEGRLKDADYVRNIVAFYRAKLDEVLKAKGLHKCSSGTAHPGFTPDPAKTFNREYTTYYIDGGKQKTGSIDTPKSLGEHIGTVTAVHADSFELKGAAVHNGDGICFLDARRILCGTTVDGVQGSRVRAGSMAGITVGTEIRRNRDMMFARALARSTTPRTMRVDFTFEAGSAGIALDATDEDGVHARATLACTPTPADNPAAAAARIAQQLAKCGGTEFTCGTVKDATNGQFMVAASVVNAVRRDALAALRAARASRLIARHACIEPGDTPYPLTKLDYRGNVLNKKARAFYHRHGVKDIATAAEAGNDMRGVTVMATRYCIRHQLGMCTGRPGRNAESLWLEEDGRRLRIEFDCSRCGMAVYVDFCRDE